MLIRELLSKGSKQLGRERTVRGLELELVLAHVLGMSREDVVAHDDLNVTTESSIRLFNRYVDELCDGKPLAYILKSKEFYGMDFYVDERVLVPRPETEMLVDAVLEHLNERAFVDNSYIGRVVEGVGSVYDSVNLGKDFRILDVGTGSGCVVAAILNNFDNSVGVACDISTDALAVARENLSYHGLEDRCELVESDLLSAFDDGEQFDVIVTNPPYVAEAGCGDCDDVVSGVFDDAVGSVVSGSDVMTGPENFIVDANVAKWEPAGALYAGMDGMNVYKKLVQELVGKQVGFNLLVGEFGAGQKDAIFGLLNKNFIQTSGGSSDVKFEVEIKNDLAGIPRIFIVRKVK